MTKFSLTAIEDILTHHQRKIISTPELKQAAVLVPLVQEHKSIHLLLTKRTHTVEYHKGQISFPGGMVDAADGSAIHTALRETEEEIGLLPSSITILGILDDLAIPSGFVVTPIVGYIQQLPLLQINSSEVAEIISIPLEKFFDTTFLRTEIRELKGINYRVLFYDVWKEPVWGATASIIKQLTDILQRQERTDAL